MTIDKQRVAAVAALEALGFSYTPEQGWLPPISHAATAATDCPPHSICFVAEADAMHALLVIRADKLMGCPDEFEGATELHLIAAAAEAYEIKRWPRGKIPGGKG